MADPHPFLVHFAVAFVTLSGAIGVFEVLWGRRVPWGDLIAILGLLSAVAAALSGESAFKAYEPLPAELAAWARRHEAAATWAAWVTGVAVVLRLAVRLRLRKLTTAVPPRAVSGRKPLGVIAALATVAAAILVLRAGALGGTMVHERGLTRATMPLRSAGERPIYEGFRTDSTTIVPDESGTGGSTPDAPEESRLP